VASGELLDGYAGRVDDALTVLDQIEEQITAQATAGRVIVIVLGIALALGQTVPIAGGVWGLKRPLAASR
jgi:hypothetical protein